MGQKGENISESANLVIRGRPIVRVYGIIGQGAQLSTHVIPPFYICNSMCIPTVYCTYIQYVQYTVYTLNDI